MHVKARLVAAAIAALCINVAHADGSGTGANSWIGYTFGGNQATAPSSAVAAGGNNLASGQNAFVGAGFANQANGISSLVIGGFDNRAVAIDSLVGAGAGNRATGARSVVVGGGYNLASGQFSFIGGGGRDGTVATPAGTSTFDHIAAGDFSVIGGGQGNRTGAGGLYATLAGGRFNSANGAVSTVAGGVNNVASGLVSSALGGSNNVASGAYSVAAGYFARADQDHCFVFGGWEFPSPPSSVPSCLGSGNIARFMGEHGLSVDYHSPRPDGGGTRWIGIGDLFVGQTISTWTGAFLSDTGVWTNNSDRASKSDFTAVNVRDVLARVVEMPISNWRYNADDAGVRHIGPMAQDFHAAFRLGQDEKHIGTIDADGVALAAIQGLHQLVQEKDAQIAALQTRADRQQLEMVELRQAVQLLLARSSLDGQIAQR